MTFSAELDEDGGFTSKSDFQLYSMMGRPIGEKPKVSFLDSINSSSNNSVL